ncbi:MAG: HAMP domain-containing protein, partial [Halobaculum sp.]
MSDSDGGASGGVLDRVRGSYAAKLVVAFLVLTLIVAGIGGNTVIATQDAVRDSTQDQLRRTAELQAETLSRWVGSMRKEAVLLSSKPALRADDPADVTPFLNGELSSGRLSDSVAALHVVEPKDGLLTVTASTSDAFVGVHPAQQGVPWAGNLSFDATTDTIVSAPFEAPNGKFVFAVISPVPGTDRKLVMMVSLAARSEGLTQPSENGATVVVDGRGTTVLSTNVSAVGTPHGGTADGVDSEPVQRGLAGESGARVVDTDGNRVAVGYAPVAGTDWVVTSRVPAQQAFAVSRMVGRDILLLLGATLLGLVVIGGVVGHRTLRPLRELSETAAALERGELDTEIETGRTDEIGDLYRGFDEMRASLRDRIAEAERATEAAERERERIAERSQRLETLVTRLCRAMEAAANGDLTIRVETDAEIEEMEELLTRFNGLMAS